MPLVRRFGAALATLFVCSTCMAQFSGPAPLAWRWAQPTSVAPGGNAVANGDVLYAAIGSRLYAVDKGSGNQIWKFPQAEPLDGNFRTGALFAEGNVIAAADNKLIYAVDAATGQSKWQYFAPANVMGVPLIIGKYVVFAMADNSVMAIYAADGKPAWNNPQRIFDGILGSIGTNRDSVLLVTMAFKLMSINLATQKVEWETRFSILGPDVRPVSYGDAVYINSGQFLVCLNGNTGRKRWDVNVRDDLARNPAVSADGIAVVSRDGRLYTFDLNGRPILKKPVDMQSVAISDPVLIPGIVAVPTSNGSLNLIDIKTGDVKWNYIVRPLIRSTESSDPFYVTAASAPVLSGETLFLVARDGSILAFDKNLGVDLTPPTVRLVFPTPGETISGNPPLQFAILIQDEASGVNMSSVKAEMDGKLLDSKLTRDGWLTIDVTTVGPNKPLTEGRRKLSITASDWLGNSKTTEYSIMVDNTLKPSGKYQAPAGTGGPGGAPGRGTGGGGGGAGAGI